MNPNQSNPTAAAKGLFRSSRSILAVCTPVLMLLSVAHGVAQEPTEGPPPEAQMPGYIGMIPFMPPDWKGEGVTTYWRDTDGVKPGVAGCHIGVNRRGVRNGRFFGEACQSTEVLIETNPDNTKIHEHLNDTGHPDLFDCAKWCAGTRRGTGGQCTAVSGRRVPRPCTTSAVCTCN
jgi:hypothetical protein